MSSILVPRIPTDGGEKIPYALAKSSQEAYVTGPNPKLRFLGGKNGNMIINGFRIQKEKIIEILQQEEEVTDLYIFLALCEDTNPDLIPLFTKQDLRDDQSRSPDYTIVFSAIKPYTNGTGENYSGQVCDGILYDYVDPCPTKCPKFK